MAHIIVLHGRDVCDGAWGAIKDMQPLLCGHFQSQHIEVDTHHHLPLKRPVARDLCSLNATFLLKSIDTIRHISTIQVHPSQSHTWMPFGGDTSQHTRVHDCVEAHEGSVVGYTSWRGNPLLILVI